MGFPYNFVARIFNVGTGVERLGLQKPQTDPLFDGWVNRRHAVRGQLDPQRPGMMYINQQFVPVAINGNGLYLQGQMELQKLAQLSQ